MEQLRRLRAQFAFIAAVLGPIVVALVLLPFRGNFAGTAAALTMILVVVAVAIAGNRFVGVVASASSAIWYDFFLTRPYERFTISQRPDLETTIAILVVGVIITEIAGRSRHHFRAASESTSFVSLIHDVAELATNAGPTSAIIEQAERSLEQLLYLRSCRFDAALADPPLARIESSGQVEHVGLRWPAHEIGIPGPEAEIVAQWRGQVVGRFILTPTPGESVSIERRVVAVSLVDVAAAAILDQHPAT